MNLLDRITIGQYQEIYAINKQEGDDADKAVESVSILTGKTTRDIEEMPMSEFQVLSKSIVDALAIAQVKTTPSNYLRSGKKIYQINYIVQSYRYGQYVELQHWLAGNLIENMHNILASIAIPVKKFLWIKLPAKNDSTKHKEIADDFKEVSFSEAYGCIVFFCRILSDSIKGIQDYLISEMKGKMPEEQLRKLITDSIGVMDGFTVQRGLQTSKI
jgi:hypothetical protein